MALLNWSALMERANRDGEFSLLARFWNATIRMRIGTASYRLEVKNGVLMGGDPWLGGIARDLSIEADEAEWHSLLAPVPRPFYQDLYAATIHHGFAVSGNSLNYCAYYPALRRLIELMREVRNG
jgi:hypothetical protein